MEKVLDTAYVRYELEGDLLIGWYKKDLKITLPVAREIVKTRLEFADHKPVVALVYNLGVVSFNKDARDYLASDEGVQGVIAGAIVLDSPVGSFLGNFYLSVAKPKIPSRIFSKKEAAMKWLNKYRKQM
ncbi:MAG TPA: hypothetical protein VFZ42_14395 [Chitinophagaceae bacterium]